MTSSTDEATAAPARPSDAPLREPGTRTRSGNAMARTRANLLDAAAHCVERYGVRRTTMGDIALKAVVAKATLYNHFRTKDDVLAALVDARCDALAAACRRTAAESGLAAALQAAATALAADPPLRRVVADEPGLATRLAVPAPGRGWDHARARVAGVLAAAGVPPDPTAVTVVLRWLAGQVLWPAAPQEAALAARLLEGGLVSVPSPGGADRPDAGT